MSDCNHPPEALARIDDGGQHIDGDRVDIWGECECGAAVLVRMDITSIIEDDGEGRTYSDG